MKRQYPVIITVRDRLSPLRQLLEWLEVVGQHDIWLCDNATTYGPLVEYLAVTPYKVVRNTRNLGHRAPWLSGLAAEIGHDKPFIVTDPDVVPTAGCPYDVLELFEHTLHSHTEFDKVGFSLKIDDLPDHYANKADVIAWETQFWTDKFSPRFYRAPIDTTFAMYRPGLNQQNGKALRSAPPYEARHLPWYQNSSSLTEEDRYYTAHVDRLITNWNDQRIPANVRAKLVNLRTSGEPMKRREHV